jgi:predicted peptidase
VPRSLIALSLMLGLHGCRTGAGTPTSLEPGISEQTLPLGDGRELRYTLLIPDHGPQPRPLVLALHYGGEVTPFFGRNILELLVAPALAELGAVIVAPDAIERGWANEGNEKAVLALLDHLTGTLAIDRARVLCTGYSLGGTGTWFLAGRHPERFSAAIPMASRPIAPGNWQVPLYAIQGRDDKVAPLEPAEREIARLQAAGADVRLTVVDGVSHFQADRYVEPLRAAVPWIRAVWARR